MSAEEVARHQVEQDQADDGCPYQVCSPKVGAEQAGGGQLGGQRDQPTSEGGDVEVDMLSAHTSIIAPLGGQATWLPAGISKDA